MIELIHSFLIPAFLSYVAYQYALFSVGKMVLQSTSLENFIRSTLSWVYAMIAIVFGMWSILGIYSHYVILFGLTHAIALSLIDYKETYDNN